MQQFYKAMVAYKNQQLHCQISLRLTLENNSKNSCQAENMKKSIRLSQNEIIFAVRVSRRPENKQKLNEILKIETDIAMYYMYIRKLHNNFTQSMATRAPKHTYITGLKKTDAKQKLGTNFNVLIKPNTDQLVIHRQRFQQDF